MKSRQTVDIIYLLDLATRSSSSFFLMAKLLELPLAAFMSSSAKHSAMVLTSEGSVLGAVRHQPNSLVDSSERSNIARLSSD